MTRQPQLAVAAVLDLLVAFPNPASADDHVEATIGAVFGRENAFVFGLGIDGVHLPRRP